MNSILELLKDKLVFDVGCNIGDKTLLYLQAGARVIGFEPQTEVAEIYKQRTGTTVEIIALSSEQSTKPFWRNVTPPHGMSSMSTEFMNAWDPIWKEPRFAPIFVETDTLDHKIQKYGIPYYIKIDVEGYEFEVLKGLSKPIEIISIEWCARCKEAGLSCFNYLGPAVYNFVFGNTMTFISSEWINYDKLMKQLDSCNSIESGDVFIKRII